ncbi:MAG: GTP-binding protein [Candidatus Cloacimonadaceae bacterium]|nr:GTP-binding protein [Candidatus Cloacimonadaceae bacterium]
MPFEWISDDGIRVIAIVGICKNAGKTTLLNHILDLMPDTAFGVLSTGIDGEESDRVFKTPKPRVRLNPGCIFCCDTAVLNAHGSDVRILEKLSFGNELRPLWLAQCRQSLITEITGPSSGSDQIRTVQRLRHHGAKKVLIDGSLDRKAIGQSDVLDALVLVAGASFGTETEIIYELKRLLMLNDIPADTKVAENAQLYQKLSGASTLYINTGKNWFDAGIATLIDNEYALDGAFKKHPKFTGIYIPGAITEASLPKLKGFLDRAGSRILLRHPECLMLPLTGLEAFLRDYHPVVLIPYKIRLIAVNANGIGAQPHDAEAFRLKLKTSFPDSKLIDIMEMEI